MFQIGDIVRVINTASLHKSKYINKIGFIARIDDRYNHFSDFYITFFDSNETIVFNKLDLSKEFDLPKKED
jgi:hypothetical protein